MAQDDNTFAALAVDLAADHKAEKLRKPSFDATSIGPEPSENPDLGMPDFSMEQEPGNPSYGMSWYKPSTGVTRYWHGRSWYMLPPEDAVPEAGGLADTSEIDEYGEADNSIEVDSAGQMWSADLHSPKMTKNKDGTWRAKKGAAALESEPEAAPKPEPKVDVRPESVVKISYEVDEFVVEAPDFSEVDEDDPVVMFEEAESFNLDPRQFVPDIRDVLLDQFKNRPKPWSAMSQAEQIDCARALENTAANLVQRVIEEVSAGGHSSIRCLLESYTEKDGIKVTMKVQAFGIEDGERAVLFLHKARGKTVMLRLATMDEYKGDREPVTEPDQNDLEFDADYDGDDSDLAGE